MEKVKLKLSTKQTIDDAGNEDIIELTTDAVKTYQDDCIIIEYDESDISENSSTKTKLKIYDRKLIMTKMGDISSRMEFEKDKDYRNVYSTKYGSFDLSFSTLQFENHLDEAGRGTVYIEYRIAIGNTRENLNKIVIEIY